MVFDGIDGYRPDPADELVKDPETGHWTGFFPGIGAGTKYRFLVDGPGGVGFKRDPRAQELELYGYPDCDALVVDHDVYPWHDAGFRFTRDLIHLRRRHPALRADPVTVWQPADRVLAYQRWVPGTGRDVVVVVSLSESTFYDGSFQLGFPQPGRWHEVFNSDVYDTFPNPWVCGNNGGVDASGPGRHGFAQSAGLTVPANSVLVFARDLG